MVGAAASGCSRKVSLCRPNLQEKPLDSGGFFAFSTRAGGRENPPGLLDIGGSLC